MADDPRATPTVLLLEGPDGTWDELATRIGGLGFHPLRCETIEAAERLLEEADAPIRAVLLPAEFADRRLKRALKSLRSVRSERLRIAAVGPEPDAQDRKWLRAAGVRYGLWEPIDPTTLRFQINRLTAMDEGDAIRASERVPTRLAARATAGGRTRDAQVYSLSETGAFLATPRACMNGAAIEVEIKLPSGAIAAPATVMFANVPGNLQRPNLPLGMGVRFGQLSTRDAEALRDYVESQLSHVLV